MHLFASKSFASKILNLEWVDKTGSLEIYDLDFFKKTHLDLPPVLYVGLDYNKCFLIPSEDKPLVYFAFVPIIPTSRSDIDFKIFCNIMIILGLISFFSISSIICKKQIESKCSIIYGYFWDNQS